ncbi:MAG: extensin family protein [Hyphomicrobium sp.]|nr:extensin family protein [Hyphomicrobium sp.]
MTFAVQHRIWVAAAVLAFAAGVVAVPALAKDPAPVAQAPAAAPATSKHGAIQITITPSWPKTVPEAKAEADAKTQPPESWAPQEIADAKARCAVILKKINAVAIPEAPIKEGACGAPAPVQLISIGTKPQVSISPPAIVTCEMAEALSQWVENDLQPLAKSHIGAEIIKIETMSSYSCRNAYGRAKNKLSEHGVANALDIRGFVTASAKTAYVLEDWGKPQREIVAEIAAAKEAEEKATALKAEAEKAAQANQMTAKGKLGPAPGTPPSATASSAGAPASGIARNSIADGIPKLTVTIPGAKRVDDAATGFAIGEPNKLGGPKDAAKSVVRKTDFLHAAHTAACQIFGTTLGPEANAAHRNHFHVDMAARKVTKICD